MEPLLSVRGLTKSFKKNRVLCGINFDVMPGEVLCILGPNGAGKSTTINILTSALSADKGEINFKGKSIAGGLRTYKQQLGIVPQDIALYEDLSAERNLRFFASLYGLRGSKLDAAVEKVLAFAELIDRRQDQVKTFSSGMKRRLNIACAIAHQPALVIMDEPTVGIDPQSRNHILESILRLRDEGTTVIYTTHYMEEVEAISSRIIILDHGAIIAEGTKESLKESVANERHCLVEVDVSETTDGEDAVKALGALRLVRENLFSVDGVKSVRIDGTTIDVVSVAGIENVDGIVLAIVGQGLPIKNMTSVPVSLETVFLQLTGRKLRD
jgi:ABC-2 type transport system ATP-binding protein